MNSNEKMDNFVKRMSDFEASLHNIIGSIPSTLPSPTVDSLKLMQNLFQSFKSFVTEEIKSMNSKIQSQDDKIDDLESYSRRNCLLLHGIPESTSDSTEDDCLQAVLDVFQKKMKVQVSAHHIDRTHRLGPKKQKARPVIVKFCSYVQRRLVFLNKSSLKGSNVSITESLTKTRMNILKEARQSCGNMNAWTNDGRIIVKIGNVKHKITTMAQLERLINKGSMVSNPLPASQSPDLYDRRAPSVPTASQSLSLIPVKQPPPPRNNGKKKK